MRIVVAPKAREDLRDAYEYIARNNPEAAERVLTRIVEVIGMLASGAVEGREVRCVMAGAFRRGLSLRSGFTTERAVRSFK